MEIALIVAFIFVLLLITGGDKSKTQSSKRDAEVLRFKITIEETRKSQRVRTQRDQKPALFTSSTLSKNHLPMVDMTQITRGLIIAEPWISKILQGEKTWEMRSQRTKIRGPIALIKKGSKTVLGVCKLEDVDGPFAPQELALHEGKHQISPEIYEAPDYKWRYAWVLTDVEPLAEPIPYEHKSGSVIWVKLDERVIAQLTTTASVNSSARTYDIDEGKDEIWSNKSGMTKATKMSTVPFARDGAHFDRHHCALNGVYFVESKQGTLEFSDYDEALDYMRNMAVAHWARKSPNGGWEVVGAYGWKVLIEN